MSLVRVRGGVRVSADVRMRSEMMAMHSSWNVAPFAQTHVVVGMLRQGCCECEMPASLPINTVVFAVMMTMS